MSLVSAFKKYPRKLLKLGLSCLWCESLKLWWLGYIERAHIWLQTYFFHFREVIVERQPILRSQRKKSLLQLLNVYHRKFKQLEKTCFICTTNKLPFDKT